jgi:hypothetical protein
MKHLLPWITATLLAGCMSSAPLLPSSPQRLDAGAVRALFVDHTVESYNRNNQLTSFTYYHPDGRVLQQRFWSYRAGSWRVLPDGRICLKFTRERCRYIERVGDVYYKVVPRKGRAVRYRQFLPGNRLLGEGAPWPQGPQFHP